MSVKHGSVGRLSKFGTAAQVIVTTVLAMSAVLLVNWLVGRPGIRQRFDLTATSKHTLSTAMEGLLDRLEDEVKIEILFRPEAGPRMQLDAEVMQRTTKLLTLIETAGGGKVDVEVLDTTDVVAWQERQRKIGITGFPNGLLVTHGERHAFLPLVGKLAQFDGGRVAQEGYIPPRVIAFNAEESIAEAVLDVTRGEKLHAYFTFGFGEPDALEVDANDGLGRLTDELAIDGLWTHRWNQLEDGDLPDDCAVLVAVAPDRPWPEAMYAQIVQYVERGGRLVVAPHLDPASLRNSDIPDLLERFGLEVSEGRVCKPHYDPYTRQPVDGHQQCELHLLAAEILPAHPILKAFREAGVGVVIPMAHQVRVVSQPEGGVAQHLALSTHDSWLDAAPIDRRYDPRVDGQQGQFPLAATYQGPTLQEMPTPGGLEAELQIRIAAIGSPVAFSNVGIGSSPQFLRSVFQWVTDREHRIVVPPRDPDLRFLPRDDGGKAIVAVTRFAQFWLPGAVLLIGILVWFTRSRGARRRPSAQNVNAA